MFRFILVLLATIVYGGFSVLSENTENDLPNILWITSEDNSPLAGCYGDAFASTPNMDKLASRGFLYTHAYANAPVCAPARSTIITGVYACSSGTQHMRSFYRKSDDVKLYPEFLRELGYYCTNNSKEDYNMSPTQTKGIWDDSSESAHYKNRKPGQPFFSVFNITISHESCIHKYIHNENLRHDPEKVSIAPYHPDTEEMRHDWAQYYDKIEDMDSELGRRLKELDEAGLTSNTIVFYYGDHGGVLGRSKRFVYETGTRVPFIVRIPEKYKYLFPAEAVGTKVERLISFVDLAPTLLSIAGVKIPEFMQGNAFLGEQKTKDPEYAFMFRGRMDERYDMCRAVRDRTFRYIRNYMPYRIYGQHINYLWKAPSLRSWEQSYLKGECSPVQSAFWNKKPVEELYDTENDPWEINNLANNPAFEKVLIRMRNANKRWALEIFDAGYIPEAERNTLAKGQSIYDYMRCVDVDMDAIIEAAELASLGDKANLDQLIQYLDSKNSVIRYWGANGLLILGQDAKKAIDPLKKASLDEASNVSVVAAEALYYLGETELAINTFLRALKNEDPFARVLALNALDYADVFSQEILSSIEEMIRTFNADRSRNRYDLRVVEWLYQKNGIKKDNLKTNFAL